MEWPYCHLNLAPQKQMQGLSQYSNRMCVHSKGIPIEWTNPWNLSPQNKWKHKANVRTEDSLGVLMEWAYCHLNLAPRKQMEGLSQYSNRMCVDSIRILIECTLLSFESGTTTLET
jgi:hypothetical protein